MDMTSRCVSICPNLLWNSWLELCVLSLKVRCIYLLYLINTIIFTLTLAYCLVSFSFSFGSQVLHSYSVLRNLFTLYQASYISQASLSITFDQKRLNKDKRKVLDTYKYDLFHNLYEVLWSATIVTQEGRLVRWWQTSCQHKMRSFSFIWDLYM